MQKVSVPKTDLHASIIVLGTDYFGSTVSREESMQLMDNYLEAGGNMLDTAEVYASFVPGGDHQSETVIGEWLRDRRVRDQVILSTKGAHPSLATMHVPRMSKAEIQSDLDSSLQRLGVEQVDLFGCTGTHRVILSKKSSRASNLSGQVERFAMPVVPTGLKHALRRLVRRHRTWVFKGLLPVRTCGAWLSRRCLNWIQPGLLSMSPSPSGTSNMAYQLFPLSARQAAIFGASNKAR
jgi:hypothetical protein